MNRQEIQQKVAEKRGISFEEYLILRANWEKQGGAIDHQETVRRINEWEDDQIAKRA